MAETFCSILDYLDPRVRARLPERLTALWATVEVSTGRGPPHGCRIRASHIRGWWFCWIEGQGSARVLETRKVAPPDDYVLLALMMGGQNWLKGEDAPIQRPGEIALYIWGGPYAVVSSGEFRYLIAHIPRAELEAVADDPRAIPYGRSASSNAGPGAVLAAALRAVASEASNPATASSLAGLLDPLARLALQTFEQAPTVAVSSPARARFARVRDYIEAHHQDPRLSPSITARACGVSDRQMFRDLAAEGTSFTALLRQVRLDQAAARLADPATGPIAEIAFACGFRSHAQFSRIFREAHGRTPSAYRKEATQRVPQL